MSESDLYTAWSEYYEFLSAEGGTPIPYPAFCYIFESVKESA